MAVPAREFGRERQWTVAKRIRTRRLALKLTQRELLERLADQGLVLSKGALSQIEGNGADLAKLVALAIALECSVTYLMGLSKDPRKWSPDGPLEQFVTPSKPTGQRHHLSVVPGTGDALPTDLGRKPKQ